MREHTLFFRVSQSDATLSIKKKKMHSCAPTSAYISLIYGPTLTNFPRTSSLIKRPEPLIFSVKHRPPNPDVCLQHANKAFPSPPPPPTLSSDRIYLHFLGYSNAARGAACPLTPPLANCLTIIACTPFCAILAGSPHMHPAPAGGGGRGSLQTPLCDLAPGLQCFIIIFFWKPS